MLHRSGLRNMNSVSTPSAIYEKMNKRWKFVEDIRGGTEVMHEKGELYLPQEPAESNTAYRNRLKKSELFNLYSRTLSAITGLAFIKPVVVSNVPEELKYLEFNFDSTGRSITECAFESTINALHYGVTHFITDFPVIGEEVKTLKDFKEGGYKPYVQNINPTRMIGWRLSEDSSVPEIEHIRIVEERIEGSDEDEWLDKVVKYVRVYYADRTDTYRYDPERDEDYNLASSAPRSLGYIPLTTAYGNKEGFMEGSPALYDLARLNLAHYQLTSDHRNILHIASVPFMLASGFQENELQGGEIGTNRIIVSDRADARIQYVEHTGKAVEAGSKYIQDIENQMASLGADLLLSKGVSRMTATARRLDQNESMSTLQLALRSVEQALERAYEMAGEWLGVDASNVSISIGDDLSIANEPNPTNALISLRATGLLTDEQVVEEGKRLGILSSYFTLDPNRPSKEAGDDPSMKYEEDESESKEEDQEAIEQDVEQAKEDDDMERLIKALTKED